MKLAPTGIAGLFVADTAALADNRGSFARLFCASELAAALGGRVVAQANYSVTHERGTVRGLHFQNAPHAEMKLVRCLKGRVFDVAVDLRRDSPTFLRWHAEELSGDNRRMLVIPEGCAHGFQALEPMCEMLYLHTHPYVSTAEGGLRHDDPALAIRWPLPVTQISARDSGHPLLSAGFAGLAA